MRMRRRTRDVAANLAAIKAEKAVKLSQSGEAVETPILAISPGDLVLVRAGERIAVDGFVEDGRSEIDQSLVTGETAPAAAARGVAVYAGTLNLTGALRVRVAQAAAGTLLDEINALLEKATEQRSRYVRLADRAGRPDVPVVHLTALGAFHRLDDARVGWDRSLLIAITVLIITCPCALALAVPAVQVVAASAMFRRGMMLNGGDALERLATVDTIVFDKTGTLTLPHPALANAAEDSPEDPRSPARSRSRAAIRSPRLSLTPREPPFRSPPRISRLQASPSFMTAKVSGSARSNSVALRRKRPKSPSAGRRFADRLRTVRAKISCSRSARLCAPTRKLRSRGSRRPATLSKCSPATAARPSPKPPANSASASSAPR